MARKKREEDNEGKEKKKISRWFLVATICKYNIKLNENSDRAFVHTSKKFLN